MTADSTVIDACARALDEAALAACAIAPPPAQRDIGMDDAYRIQQVLLARRLSRGERLVGLKMGFTSTAKMAQMGVSDQIFGRLTDAMQVTHGAAISLQGSIHPRCEPEIAFLLAHSLPAGIDEAQAFAAIAAVAPALEIIDSRYRQFKFSLTDVIADNASSARFVIGPWVERPQQPALLNGLPVVMRIDGLVRQSGSSADILGDPLRSLVAAARLAAQHGVPLQAGDIVLAGAATSAEALASGNHVEAEVAGLGTVLFSVT